MAYSLERSTYLLVLHKQLLPREKLDAVAERARRLEMPLLRALEAHLDREALDRIERTLARHARHCASCGQATWLLPNQTEQDTPCEHCQGVLLRPGAPLAAPSIDPAGDTLGFDRAGETLGLDLGAEDTHVPKAREARPAGSGLRPSLEDSEEEVDATYLPRAAADELMFSGAGDDDSGESTLWETPESEGDEADPNETWGPPRPSTPPP